MKRGEGLEGGQWVVTGIQRDGPQGRPRQGHETAVSWAKDRTVSTMTGRSGQWRSPNNMTVNGITLNNLFQCALKKRGNYHYEGLNDFVSIKVGNLYVRRPDKWKVFNRYK